MQTFADIYETATETAVENGATAASLRDIGEVAAIVVDALLEDLELPEERAELVGSNAVEQIDSFLAGHPIAVVFIRPTVDVHLAR